MKYVWLKVKTMTKKQILKLIPEFPFGQAGMKMRDWFTITEGKNFCCISSGLRHADCVTKSPYFYEDHVVGKNATKEAIRKFSDWWESLPNK